MKTRGLLDPVRGPDGSTTWRIGEIERVSTRQNRDLLTPEIAADLQRSWDAYQEMLAWDDARWRGLLQDATDPAPVSGTSTQEAGPGSASTPDPSKVPTAELLPATGATADVDEDPDDPLAPPF